jgi:hypothetical protein
MDDELVETGLGAIADGASVWKEPAISTVAEQITVAVNPGLTIAGKDAAKVLIKLPEMTHGALASLAREVAMDIKTHDSILLMYKLSNAQYEYLKEHNDFFKAALHSCAIEWHSALTTPERIKIEAAAALEDAMPRLSARMVNIAEGLPGVTEVAKLFAKIAGVGEREQGQGAPGERFTISINLGGDEKLIVSSKDVTPPRPAQSGSSTIPADPEGARDPLSLRADK